MELEQLAQQFGKKLSLVDPAGVPVQAFEGMYDADLEHEKIMHLLAQYEAEIEKYIMQGEQQEKDQAAPSASASQAWWTLLIAFAIEHLGLGTCMIFKWPLEWQW